MPPPEGSPRPAGLAHLARELFRPLRRVTPSADATGLELIEAPGLVGEVRLVARRVKRRLVDGVPPDDLDLVVRDLNSYAELIGDTFAEYAIPVDIEGGQALDRHPPVAVLLRALHLPADDFPFAGVTALLRHNAFRPRWPEVEESPELPLQAEALLRLLAEPRGKQAYLAAVDRWAEEVQPGLEDEEAEAGRRKRTHELARQCRPFLHRFFAAWDGFPTAGSVADYSTWIERFAATMGFADAATDPADRAAWEALCAEVDAWRRRNERGDAAPLDSRTFLRRLTALARTVTLPRTTGGPGRVRVVSAGRGRHLAVRERFVLGLGERGFPRAGGPPSLFDDADRETLRSAGVPLTAPDDLADEMLLFYQIVTAAEERLTLSYPAVDDRGQELLPSSFLSAARGVSPTRCRRSSGAADAAEPVDVGEPLSAAEYRVQTAARWPHGDRGAAVRVVALWTPPPCSASGSTRNGSSVRRPLLRSESISKRRLTLFGPEPHLQPDGTGGVRRLSVPLLPSPRPRAGAARRADRGDRGDGRGMTYHRAAAAAPAAAGTRGSRADRGGPRGG
ncbi:MAG: hypothetical protein U0736_01705 [Gemmataceae bacterium]